MRKKILHNNDVLAAMTAFWHKLPTDRSSDSLYIRVDKSYSQELMLMPVNPTYLKNVEAANRRNWFM